MSLKKFEILEMIAKGGMAEVYRAKTVGFQGFEKEVCVKKILPHLTEDESFVTMFINEAKLAATLNYANIVQVHDLCVSASGEYFIVMEYVHGKDLSDVIRAAQLGGREIPPAIAVFMCREVCKGLHYAHSKTDLDGAPLSIIHRDVSPHNVLVSFMGEVKITDFGIAKASSIMNKTAVGILKGKYGYMSPEQARGQPLDHRSDIFNTGILLYELLVGERCFAGSSDFSTLNLMRNAEVTPPTKVNSSVPKQLEDIVLRSLSLDRKDRFPDALELERALGEWALGANKAIAATELADFMRELFRNAEERKQDNSTGVLSLSSVVGHAPKSPDEPAKHAVEPAAPEPEKAAEPGREALERMKRRATRARSKAEEPLPVAAPEPKVETPAPAVASRKATPIAKLEAPEPAKPAEPEKPAKVEKVAAKAEAPPAEPKERKPARIKPTGKAEEPPKKKGKQLSDTPKKPVGRRDLRPGLTQLSAMRGGVNRRKLMRASLFIFAAAGLGAAIGVYRANEVSRQSTFREMELANREGPPRKTITVLIDSEPRGASVRFDDLELAGVTPVAVERDYDSEPHVIVLSKASYKRTTRSIKFDKGAVTYFVEPLEGDPGKLKIASTPSEQPVRIDGKLVGETPFLREVPFGKHVVEIGGDGRGVVREEVEVGVGKTVRLDVQVPDEGAKAKLRLASLPRGRIFVNGKPTGQWTNDGALELAPGVEHQIRVEVDKQHHEDLVVKLGKGEEKAIFLDLGES